MGVSMQTPLRFDLRRCGRIQIGPLRDVLALAGLPLPHSRGGTTMRTLVTLCALAIGTGAIGLADTAQASHCHGYGWGGGYYGGGYGSYYTPSYHHYHYAPSYSVQRYHYYPSYGYDHYGHGHYGHGHYGHSHYGHSHYGVGVYGSGFGFTYYH
jgi:hypothetical protein